jgi:hypothetical protein
MDIRRRVMGIQQTIQNKNTPNLSLKKSQEDNWRPLVRLKSNIAQRTQYPVCTRNHTSCQQIKATHHWPQQLANM